jgi:hypothetical protein
LHRSRLNANGLPSHGDFGNTFLKLTPQRGKLLITDYFTMFNVAAENAVDSAFGSGGPMVLPNMEDATGKTWRLAVGAGKDLSIYVVNRDGMGKFSKQGNQAVYQELPHVLKQQYSRPIPAYYNGRLYYASTGDTLREFRFENARLIVEPESYTSLKFVYPDATPSISANGKQNGIVWVTENLNPAVLHAYVANDLGRELYNSNQAASGRDQFGAGNKFVTPMIANGKVYIGTTEGVGVFGLRDCHHFLGGLPFQ